MQGANRFLPRWYNDMPDGVLRAFNGLFGNESYTSSGAEYFYLVMGKDSKEKLTMISGVAASGTQIPLPADCLEADCHWIVSVAKVQLAVTNAFAMSGFECEITAGRVCNVRCRAQNWVS